MPVKPWGFQASTIMIWKVEQASVPTSGAEVDFNDNKMLAAGNWVFTSGEGAINDQIIFDNEIFNQDIYITHTEEVAAEECNYYLELEQIKLDLNQNTVATLKDIRNEKVSLP
jgi:hypothetical protein